LEIFGITKWTKEKRTKQSYYFTVSTNECERNVSLMNKMISPLRAALNINTVHELLFISCVGPPLMKFHPEKYVRLWLAKGRRIQLMIQQKSRNEKKL